MSPGRARPSSRAPGIVSAEFALSHRSRTTPHLAAGDRVCESTSGQVESGPSYGRPLPPASGWIHRRNQTGGTIQGLRCALGRRECSRRSGSGPRTAILGRPMSHECRIDPC